MTERDIQRLAHAIILEASMNDDLLAKIARMIQKETRKSKHLVSAKQAALMLGISISQLYHIKDDDSGTPRFSYIKTGGQKSSTLKFNADTLAEEYERFCASR